MSMDIYAGRFEAHEKYGQIMGPVSGFADGTTINLSNSNAEFLMSKIGLAMNDEGGPSDFPIEEAHRAIMRGLNGAAARYTEEDTVSVGEGGATFFNGGVPDGYMEKRLNKLLAIVVDGKKLGATHLCVS